MGCGVSSGGESARTLSRAGRLKGTGDDVQKLCAALWAASGGNLYQLLHCGGLFQQQADI